MPRAKRPLKETDLNAEVSVNVGRANKKQKQQQSSKNAGLSPEPTAIEVVDLSNEVTPAPKDSSKDIGKNKVGNHKSRSTRRRLISPCRFL